jgi:hypothetical protein
MLDSEQPLPDCSVPLNDVDVLDGAGVAVAAGFSSFLASHWTVMEEAETPLCLWLQATALASRWLVYRSIRSTSRVFPAQIEPERQTPPAPRGLPGPQRSAGILAVEQPVVSAAFAG